MFEKPEPLMPSRHMNLRFERADSYMFSKRISSVKLSFSEIRYAASYYPIVFLGKGPCLPQALLSVEKEKNGFIDAQGQWKVPYVPLFFRLYPFMLAKTGEDKDKARICIDHDAPHFKCDMGEPLFSADGNISDYLKTNILEPLKTYHTELKMTEKLFSGMDKKSLIVDKVFIVQPFI